MALKNLEDIDIKKKGIEGILDPFASGIIIVGVNSATRYLSYLHQLPKTYQATIQLGIDTTTLDITGDTVQKKPIQSISKEVIQKTMNNFIGFWEQVPPVVSNIKYKGKPLRKQQNLSKEILSQILEDKKKKVQIHAIQYLNHTDNTIEFECTVSAGTYIRSLACAIAKKLNNIGVLSQLKRTSIGNFTLKDTTSIDEMQTKQLKLISHVLYFLPSVSVNSKELLDIQNGKKLDEYELQDGIYQLNHNSDFYGLVNVRENKIQVHRLEPLV